MRLAQSMNLKIKYWIRYLAILQLGLSFASYSSPSTAPSTTHSRVDSNSVQATPITSRPTSQAIDWIDLLPSDLNREALMERYADLIIQRLDATTDSNLQAKIIAEFAQAPTNPNLAGHNIRLAGYMLVLESREDRITEFLLVPYSGAGLHQPTPPANQMILVRVQPEQALKVSQEYESVWVEGKLQIQSNTTASTQVSYLIDPAQVKLYTAEDAKQAAASTKATAHNEHEHESEHKTGNEETHAE